ncbi:unnamed protein product, partial [Prorocentrum cordatum]
GSWCRPAPRCLSARPACPARCAPTPPGPCGACGAHWRPGRAAAWCGRASAWSTSAGSGGATPPPRSAGAPRAWAAPAPLARAAHCWTRCT